MPTPALLGVPIRDLVAFATRAPSVHNTQPWHWCVTGERLALFADSSRQLQHADPDGRDLVISCGAALHHLQVAAAGSGWKTLVRRMPNPYNDAQLANVFFRPAPATSEALAALGALAKRRTDRRRPSSWPVPRERLDRLLALGPGAGVTIIGVVSHQARAELLAILAEAEQAQRLNRRYVDEIIDWTGREDDQGIPASSLLRRGSAPGPTPAPSRFPSGTLTDHHADSEPVQPALLAICTSSDDTQSRLRAGEALSAMLLKGTFEGLAMIPLSQAIEVDRTRHLLQHELLRDALCPQIIVQVGSGLSAGAQVPLTARRPVDDVLSDVASLPPWIGPYHA
jgi:hypothetical protein